MTLEQWCKNCGIYPTHPTTELGATSVIINHDDPYKWLLWRLIDYKVSSACGVVIWLVPNTL